MDDLKKHDDQFDFAPQNPARDVGDHEREVVLDIASARSMTDINEIAATSTI